jgi:hypothetical protein
LGKDAPHMGLPWRLQPEHLVAYIHAARHSIRG